MSPMCAEHDKLVPLASGNACYSSVPSIGLQRSLELELA